jgi:hypothetical protein
VAQPPELDPGIRRVVGVYEAAQARMGTRLADALESGDRAAVARLRSLLGSVDREVDAIQTAHRLFLTDDMLAAYRMGAAAAAAAAGHDVVWTQLHREAVQALAASNWNDVLKATKFLRADTKRTLRNLAKSAAARTVLGEATASAAGRGLADAVRKEAGLLTIRYANGARHSVADWADTSARTSSALAFNEGTFVQAGQDGIRWMECIDGPACGLDFHGVAPFANGMVLSLREAREHPLAHPRCARSWSPRPDATGPERSGMTPDAFEAAAKENARAAERLVTGERRGKFSVARELQRNGAKPPRTPRQPRGSTAKPKAPTPPRTPRVPRQPKPTPEPVAQPTPAPTPVAPRAPGPVGRKIDEFVEFDPNLPPKVREATDHALEQMRKVHGYGDAKMNPAQDIVGTGRERRLVPRKDPNRVPIRELDRRKEANGEFLPSKGTNAPIEVRIKRIIEETVDPESMKTVTGKVRHLRTERVPDPGTVAHELGHLADVSMLSPPGETWMSKTAWEMRKLNRREQALASRTDDASKSVLERTQLQRADLLGTKDPDVVEAFGKLYDAIEQTDTYKVTSRIGSSFWDTYANTPHELFARSYAQWIADRSGSPLMRQWLDEGLEKRNKPLAAQVGYGHEQWTHEEFGPVAEAMDELMKVLGWLT